jgi:hypothetical protein
MPRDWIGGQIHYFDRNLSLQLRVLRRLDSITRSLIAASIALAGMLCLYLWLWQDEGRASLMHWTERAEWLLRGRWSAACSVVVWTIFASVLIVLWGMFVSERDHGDASGKKTRPVTKRSQWRMNRLTEAIGIGAAMVIALAIQSGAIWLAGSADVEATDLVANAKDLTIVVIVMLSAIAGAIRYVSENLNFEAQALGYRDALQRFKRAERLLAKGTDANSGNPADEPLARQVVHELALLALKENEMWLIAHRERPLDTP